jgi:NDP-sugar pyrophosphorylase family protein
MTLSVNCAIIVTVGLSAHQTQLAYSRSRAMLPALGKPLAARVIERLHRANIQRYIVVVGEDEGAVAAYLNNHHLLPDVPVEFIVQSNADSMNYVLQAVASRYPAPFVATSYNRFAHPHFAERLLKQGTELSGALVLSGAEAPLSHSEHGFIGHIEGDQVLEIGVLPFAPEHQSVLLTDLALCGQAFIEHIVQAKPRRSLMELFQDYVNEGQQPASIVRAGWVLQVYTDEDLHALNRYLFEEAEDASLLSEVPASVQIIPPVQIDPQVSVGPEACLGPYVYLEAGSSVGHHAVIRNTLVLQRAIIPPHAIVADSIVSSRSPIPM